MKERLREADFFLRKIGESEYLAGDALKRGNHKAYRKHMAAVAVLKLRWGRARTGHYIRKTTP